MPEKDLRLVEARLGELLTARGYEPSGSAPISVSGPYKLWLTLKCKIRAKRFEYKRYGSLALKRSLARRLRLKGIERQAKLQMDEVTAQYLK